jgi:hypothetical protein
VRKNGTVILTADDRDSLFVPDRRLPVSSSIFSNQAKRFFDYCTMGTQLAPTQWALSREKYRFSTQLLTFSGLVMF